MPFPLDWRVRRFDLDSGGFHALEVPSDAERLVWINRPTAPAVVLGSTQDEALLDRSTVEARGLTIVKRRSGGGVVLVAPGDLCWIDLVIARDDPLWDDDVGRAMHWVGRAWAAALGELGVEAEVHLGPMIATPWSRLVCFAGLGPGEVVAGGEHGERRGAKIVGISQRRTRTHARFQTAALIRWKPADLVSLLAAEMPSDPAVLSTAGLGVGVPVDRLEQTFLRQIEDGKVGD